MSETDTGQHRELMGRTILIHAIFDNFSIKITLAFSDVLPLEMLILRNEDLYFSFKGDRFTGY